MIAAAPFTFPTQTQNPIMYHHMSPLPRPGRLFADKSQGRGEGVDISPPPYSTNAEVDNKFQPPNDPEAAIKCDPKKVERFRRFIAFSLALEYGLEKESPDRLYKHEWYFFVRLTIIAYNLYRDARPRSRFPFLDWPEGLTNSEMQTEFFEPAAALGLAPRSILFRLLTFTRAIPFPHLAWSHQFMKYLYGPHIMAAKLVVDREQVFNKVFPTHTPFRAKLLKRWELVRDWRFLDLSTARGCRRYNTSKYQLSLQHANEYLCDRDYETHYEEELRYAMYLADVPEKDIILADPDYLIPSFIRKSSLKDAAHDISRASKIARRLMMSEEEVKKLGWWQRYRWRRTKAKESRWYITDDDSRDGRQKERPSQGAKRDS